MQEIILTTPTNRPKGTLPKVGIRPTIDGRRKGVRESLEEQTLSMAKSAASLITKKKKNLQVDLQVFLLPIEAF